jgi:pantothenate synthetase
MKIINNISEMQNWRNDSAKIAFVPTMGGTSAFNSTAPFFFW